MLFFSEPDTTNSAFTRLFKTRFQQTRLSGTPFSQLLGGQGFPAATQQRPCRLAWRLACRPGKARRITAEDCLMGVPLKQKKKKKQPNFWVFFSSSSWSPRRKNAAQLLGVVFCRCRGVPAHSQPEHCLNQGSSQTPGRLFCRGRFVFQHLATPLTSVVVFLADRAAAPGSWSCPGCPCPGLGPGEMERASRLGWVSTKEVPKKTKLQASGRLFWGPKQKRVLCVFSPGGGGGAPS